MVEHITDTDGVLGSTPSTRTMNKKFLIGDAVHFGWKKFVSEIGFVITVVVVSIIISGILGALSKGSGFSVIISNLLSFLFNIIIGMGIIRAVLKMTRDEKPSFGDFAVGDMETFLNYIVGTVLYGIMVVVGIVLLVIPGFIIALRFKFYSYLIIERKMNALDALKESWAITKGSTWNLFFLSVVSVLLVAAGIILFIVGIVVALPVICIAQGFVYRALTSSSPSQPEVVPAPEAPAPIENLPPAQQ